MIRKLFIVRADNEAMYRTLCNVLEGESLVEVIYDRRKNMPQQGWWAGEERRARPDVDERILMEGYAIVRLTPETGLGNIRWPASSAPLER